MIRQVLRFYQTFLKRREKRKSRGIRVGRFLTLQFWNIPVLLIFGSVWKVFEGFFRFFKVFFILNQSSLTYCDISQQLNRETYLALCLELLTKKLFMCYSSMKGSSRRLETWFSQLGLSTIFLHQIKAVENRLSICRQTRTTYWQKTLVKGMFAQRGLRSSSKEERKSSTTCRIFVKDRFSSRKVLKTREVLKRSEIWFSRLCVNT